MSDYKSPYYIEYNASSKKGTTDVKIFKNSDLIGSYVYGLDFIEPPFYPFEHKNKWYALFSEDYTASSIMELSTCETVWSTEPHTFGFCPVEFYVPKYQKKLSADDGAIVNVLRSDFQNPGLSENQLCIFDQITYHDFGFVSGCIWGDDSSLKIQFFDFKDLDKGIVVSDDRFGYVEMNGKLNLMESVNITQLIVTNNIE
jgi:hypothetical protein